MAEDWLADVQKYAPSADPDHVAGIVRYCGIALRRPDSALVAFSSPEETARVRENFLKKKLALSHADSELDAAIAAVGEQMKEDRTKNRVTVYYLLADRFGRLGDFIKAPKGVGGSKPAAVPPPAESAAEPSAAPVEAMEIASSAAASPSESPASEQPSTPTFAAASVTPPTSFGRRDTVGFGNRATAETSDSGAAAAPAYVADSDPSPTGSRWWLLLLLLLLIVVLIILFVVLR